MNEPFSIVYDDTNETSKFAFSTPITGGSLVTVTDVISALDSKMSKTSHVMKLKTERLIRTII